MPKRKKSNKLKDLAFEVARETLTPELAIEYLDENNFERNRAISKQVVKEYADRIKGGTFAAGTEVVFAQVGDRLVFVDGQHRLSGVVDSGVPMDFSVKTYSLPDEESLLRLYTTIDMGYGRTLGHAIKAYDVQNELELTSTEAGMIAAAIVLMECGWTNRRRRKGEYHDIITKVRTWGTEAQAYFDAIRGCPKSSAMMMRKAAITATALVTLRARPAKAAEFWRGVSHCEGTATDPRRLFHFFLAKVHMEQSQMNPEVLLRYIASAWNAWSQNRSLRVLKPHDVDAPLRLHYCKI